MAKKSLNITSLTELMDTFKDYEFKLGEVDSETTELFGFLVNFDPSNEDDTEEHLEFLLTSIYVNVAYKKSLIEECFEKLKGTALENLVKTAFANEIKADDKVADTAKELYTEKKKLFVESTEKLYAKDFKSLPEDEQYKRLYLMAKSSKKLCHKIVSLVADSRGFVSALSPSYADWMKDDDDYQDLVAESYITICQIIEKTPKMALGKAVYTAVWNSLRRMYRNEIKSISALAKSQETDDEEPVYTFDLDSFESPSIPRTEVLAEISIISEEICKDSRDMFILSMLMDGYNDTEIAEFLGVSRQSVNNRHKNIKARYISEYRMTDNELRRAIEDCDIKLCEIRDIYSRVKPEYRRFSEDWNRVTSALRR